MHTLYFYNKSRLPSIHHHPIKAFSSSSTPNSSLASWRIPFSRSSSKPPALLIHAIFASLLHGPWRMLFLKMSQLRCEIRRTELPTKAMSSRNSVVRNVRKESLVCHQSERRRDTVSLDVLSLRGKRTRSSVGVSLVNRAEAACLARMLMRLTGECRTWLFAEGDHGVKREDQTQLFNLSLGLLFSSSP